MKLRTGSMLALGAALAVGFALRVAVIVQSGPAPRHNLFPGMDEVNYHELAGNLRRSGIYAAWTGGFLTRSTRSPGYPATLAAVQFLTCDHAWTASILNLAGDLVNLLLVFLLAQRLYGMTAGRLAVGLYAVFGPVFLYLPLATPEIMSVTLVLLVAWCLVELPEHYGRTAPALGVLYALLIHTRPVFLPLIPALALVAFLRLRERGTEASGATPGDATVASPPQLEAKPSSSILWRNLLHAAFPAALALVLCLPWGWRNYRLHRAIVPVCVTAGWHLVNRAQTVEELSVDFLTDYIYDPAHANFAEGDYFRVGMRLSQELFRREPGRVLAGGVMRVVRGWFLPSSPDRFLMPRAYVRPIPVGGGRFVPVPDAEGVFYLLVALVIYAVWRRCRGSRDDAAGVWFRRSRALLLLLAAYVAIHVIGFPLIQYRFTVEPLLLTLGAGLVVSLLPSFSPSPAAPSGHGEFRGAENLPPVFAGMLLVAMLAAWSMRRKPEAINYPDAPPPSGHLAYAAIRQEQWRDRGNLPAGTRGSFAGIVKYSRRGLTFPADLAVAVPAADATVAMFYVHAQDAAADNPLAALGNGDCKLNFHGDPVPEDGDAIIVSGILKTGAYQDLILDVTAWQGL